MIQNDDIVNYIKTTLFNTNELYGPIYFSSELLNEDNFEIMKEFGVECKKPLQVVVSQSIANTTQDIIDITCAVTFTCKNEIVDEVFDAVSQYSMDINEQMTSLDDNNNNTYYLKQYANPPTFLEKNVNIGIHQWSTFQLYLRLVVFRDSVAFDDSNSYLCIGTQNNPLYVYKMTKLINISRTVHTTSNGVVDNSGIAANIATGKQIIITCDYIYDTNNTIHSIIAGAVDGNSNLDKAYVIYKNGDTVEKLYRMRISSYTETLVYNDLLKCHLELSIVNPKTWTKGTGWPL